MDCLSLAVSNKIPPQLVYSRVPHFGIALHKCSLDVRCLMFRTRRLSQTWSVLKCRRGWRPGSTGKRWIPLSTPPPLLPLTSSLLHPSTPPPPTLTPPTPPPLHSSTLTPLHPFTPHSSTLPPLHHPPFHRYSSTPLPLHPSMPPPPTTSPLQPSAPPNCCNNSFFLVAF